MNDLDLEILKNMMNGATPPAFAVKMLEDTCERTKLSWKARHVYLQKRRNKNGTEAWQAVLSIDGFRVAGTRHPDFAGQEGPFWSLVPPPDHVWYDNPPEGAPYASRCGINKTLANGTVATTWGVAKYKDYYAGMMWDKFPSTMIAKCAEMLAWRKTFPETFGGLYGDAELAQDEKVQPKATALKASALVGEITEEITLPEGKEVQMSVEELRIDYRNRLEMAQDGDEVKKIGREIQDDKRLDQLTVLELHMLYTKMKAKYP